MFNYSFSIAVVLGAAVFWAILLKPTSIAPPTSSFPVPNSGQSRVLLLTAYPEDVAYFFGSSLMELNRMDDDKEPRLKELARSMGELGVMDGRRVVLDHKGLKPDIHHAWNASLVAEAVRPGVLRHNITTILTFDRTGFSFHPQHSALYHGTRHLLADPRTPSTLHAHALLSATLWNRYIHYMAALQSRLDIFLASKSDTNLSWIVVMNIPVPVFAACIFDSVKAANAVAPHRNWRDIFSCFYRGFSRYLWVNEWVEIWPAA
ncbi:hypothetical protein PENSPDRAFT_738673 [Peniophora sp. CONT]|nr:hypothetical protein PENSPDRAFT_738673 [Peniophora sp. CONT]